MSRSAMRSSAALAIAISIAVGSLAHAQRPTKGEDDSAALVGEGRDALRRGELDQAAKALDQALALNPRRVEAYVLRSGVYAARKQYREGIALMRRAQQIVPTDLDVLTALGTHLVLSGNTDEGIPLLTQVVRRGPSRYDAQLLLGHFHHAAGNWPDAISSLESYFKHRPSALANEDARHRVELADSYLRLRQPAKALALFNQALAERKTDLRARIGVAWATAALDCRKARPLLRELEVVAPTYPEIWLVDGQCALALGDTGAAIERGTRYLDAAEAPGEAEGEAYVAKTPKRPSGAGHALMAEAHAARGALGEATRELEIARSLQPEHRRWSVRLANVQRRAGDPAKAIETLEEIAAPAVPAVDPDWWIELGEALLAAGKPGVAAARLATIVPDVPGHASLRVTTGAVQLAAGQAEAAIATLGDAEAIATSPRSRRLLVEALIQVAVAKLAAQDVPNAEILLARADRIEGTPVVWRNLGIARLALGKPADAVAVLDRAAQADPSPITLMLSARARALAGEVAVARPIYERALAGAKDNLEIAIDWASSELLPGGDPIVAVTALERMSPAKADGARHKVVLATARHAAGVAALRAGNGSKAVELLRASVGAEPTLAAKCDLALGTVVAGEVGPALTALRAISGQSCPFPAPADVQAAPILIAFIEGRAGGRRAVRALDRLNALGAKATGVVATLLSNAVRIVALEAAQDAYRRGQLAETRKYLAAARASTSRIGTDELIHNLAVLDLAEGKADAAIAALERMTAKLPEALVNVGLAYERKGDHVKALDAWRRARKAGVRFAPLADWIDSKERIYGDGP